MMQGRLYLLIAIALSAPLARGAGPARPDLSTAEPIAECKLQTLKAAATPRYEQPAVLYTLQSPAEDPLANYERTALGDWQMPAEAARDDPWLRLLLVGPRRPVIVDLAVLIDGKSFRDKREAWIDDVLAAAANGASEPATEAAEGNNTPPPPGTNPAENTSENDSAADGTDKSPDEAAKNVPAVAAQARQAPTMRDRLINYLATNGGKVDREEIHWLIAEWGAGPAVVVLDPSISWQRASLAPLLAYLDQDADGALTSTEIAHVESVLKQADADANDVLEVSELRRVTNRPPATPKAAGHALVVLLDDNTDWESLATNLMRIYGEGVATESAPASSVLKDRIAQGDASLDGTQLRALCAEPADVALRVHFGATGDQAQHAHAVSVLSVDPNLAESNEPVSATSDVISIDIGGDFLEFSAAQAPPANESEAHASQLAIGAVIDGNALERLVDLDQDGRFTLRERQELHGLLAALDRNEDGQVASDEIPAPIRLAVTPGPQVHELLARPTGSARTISPREAAPAPPDWFVSMDKNRDHDLSRGEFLGTTEQFRQFDTDGDGLLSVAEALKLDVGR